MKKLRIYVDTSVIGGCFDPEFREWSLSLMDDFRSGHFVPVLSGVTAAEIAAAPSFIRELFAELLSLPGQMLEVTDFATVTGTIGAITGGIALVISIKSYARVSAMKALDLRLELSRAFDNLDVVLSGIDGFLDYVHGSHLAVFSATGRLRSGAMEAFEKDFASDKSRLRGLMGTQPRREADYGKYTPGELEGVIPSVHTFQVQISSLREKYQGILASDDEHRKEIRAKH